MSVQSDWESNCPRAVLSILYHYLSHQREAVEEGGNEGETPPQEASPFCMEKRDLEVK